MLVICLCFTTILCSLLIGRNLYQGTPIFQNVIASKSSDSNGEVNKFQSGRKIQNNLDLDVIRRGGTNNGEGKTQESPGMRLDENGDVSEGSIDFAGKNDEQEKIKLNPPDTNAGPPNRNTALVKWTPATDRSLPRVLSKIIASMPRIVRMDVPNEYTKFMRGPGINAQFAVITEAFRKHGLTQRLPDVINIGVKKSGTNAVGFFVTQHPQIVHSVGNEVHFFDRNYEKGFDYYRARMGFAREGQFIFEKTPKYFVTPQAPRQIFENLPKNIKFILSVRDPVKRALSDFRHERELKVRRGSRPQPQIGFVQNVRQQRPRISAEDEGRLFEKEVLDEHGNVNASNVIVDTSNYAKHFQNWLKHFPRDRFLVIDLETLEKGAFHKLKELEEFLGLDPYFQDSMFYYDAGRHGTCMHGKRRPCPAKSTPGFLHKAEPSEATLKKLYEFYRPSNKEFMKLTGLDFPWAHL